MERVLVAGGAGFLGSHACDALLERGAEVVCVDSLISGTRRNIEHLDDRSGFTFVRADICEPLAVPGRFDAVLNFACVASPVDYQNYPLQALRAGTLGADRLLELATRDSARFLLTSTSEVYGDPLVHPQPESYWGHVNPIGPRSMYDEAKRASEAFAAVYARTLGTDVRIARIFNTYGPRMRRHDGRAVPAFMSAALAGEPLPIFGDGSQTRSLCYVDDLIDGLLRLLDSDVKGPVNLGSPNEMTVLELAELIRSLSGAGVAIDRQPLPGDDPKRRCPDISRARALLGWEPRTAIEDGLGLTLDWWRAETSAALSGARAERR